MDAAYEHPRGIRPPLSFVQALERVASARAALLVEGWSDEAALEAAAAAAGASLAGQDIAVVPVSGITNLGRFAALLRAERPTLRLAGLYDASEEGVALRALRRAGTIAVPERGSAARAGFFACERDLEDELIRAAGGSTVERLLHQEGELASFRRFQEQPGHRGRELQAQLKRFMGTRAGRKAHFGRLLAASLAPAALPLPLRAVLDFVQAAVGQRSDVANSGAAGVAKR